MNTMTIKATDLKAMMQFAAKKDARYYLEGVHFTVSNGDAVIMATDGHVAACLWCPQAEPVSFQPFILPLADIERLKLANKGHVDITVPDDGGPVALQHNGGQVLSIPIVAHYPHVARVVPAEASGDAAMFDPAILTRVGKAAHLLGAKHKTAGFQVHYNGQNSARVTVPDRDDFIGVIMPMRNTGTKPGEMPVPNWLMDAVTTSV